jgi:D-inositol-3-phosphate glycosyltransferase
MKQHSARRSLSRPIKNSVINGAAARKTKVRASAKTSRPLAKRLTQKQKSPSRPRATPVAKRNLAPVTVASRAMAVMASGVAFTAAANPARSGAFVNLLRSPNAARKTKGRLLWIGDALVPTGFATVTHAVLNHLHRDWEVIVSGVNYDGAAHKQPYQIMPAWQGGDMWGMDRFQHVCAEFDPDVVVINNDWWNVAQFADIAPKGVPLVGYMPVDGRNLDPAAMRSLNNLAAGIWYTGFGHGEAVSAGFKGARHIVPHGIDTEVFHPVRRATARKSLGLSVPKDAFIVGNINRNQPRKRLDVTIQIFATWIKRHKIRDAYLLLHCAKKDTGWDLARVAKFFGVADRLIITGGDEIRGMKSTRALRMVYNSLDAQMTTTLGEGWGLTTMEGMACGVPQIVPDSAALGEWAAPAIKIPCSRQLVHPEINTVGSLVDEAPFIEALQSLYQSPARRKELSARGLAHAGRAEFRWSSVARRFDDIITPVLRKPAAGKSKSGNRKALVR